MRSRILAGLLLAALVAVGGCAATDGPTGEAASDARAVSLEFTAEDLDGAVFDGEQLAGKPTVLWFWAPWCATCRAQAGHVARIAREYEGQINVVGVGGLSEDGDIREFARAVEGPTHLVDPEGVVWTHFRVAAQSTYLILDAAGAVVAEGYMDNDDLSAQVAELAG